jgi:capsular exopolysaccharide synthesis family protein
LNEFSKPSRNVHPFSHGGPGSYDIQRLSILRLLWNRRRVILLTILLCVGGFGLFARLRPRVYTRSCQIIVQPTVVQNRSDGAAMDAYLNTQAELITSSTAIHQLALSILKERQDKGQITLHQIGSGADDLSILEGNLSATPSRIADMINVQFTSPYSDEAAYVLSAVGEAFARFTSSETRKPRNDTMSNVVADAEKWEKEMKGDRNRLAENAREFTILQLTEGAGSVDAERLKALADEARAARVKAIEAKTSFEQLAKSTIPDPAQLDAVLTTRRVNGVLIVPGHDQNQIKAELLAVRQKLSDLKERYLPNHPAVVGAQEKVGEISAAYVLYLQQEWVVADKRAKYLEESYENQKIQTEKSTREIQGRLAMLKQQMKDDQDALEQKKKRTSLMEVRIREAAAADEQAAMTVHLRAEPDPKSPPDKVRPDTRLLLLEGLIAGIVLGLTFALVDQRVRSLNEVAAATSLPILGVIPHMPRSQSPQTRGRAVHLDPMGDVAEAFRAIRNAVHFGPQSKTILVTSAEKAEGKTTLATNLALAMAEAGQQVLLLDANLRSPMIHEIFSISNEAGLTSVLSGRAGLDRCIIPTGLGQLDLLPCGPVPFNAAETINNQIFADLLADLSEEYDYVVVDSPAVLPVTDSRILGAMCDVTLMLVRSGRTPRRAAADARDGVLGFGANLLGIVVNDGLPRRYRTGNVTGPSAAGATNPASAALGQSDLLFTIRKP